MKHSSEITQTRRQRGQSLVEVAIFFPIFIILLAGLIEVSQMVVTQNRVSNAARVGARFGANGGDDNGMLSTALNSITQTLGQDETEWDVWIIRGKVNSTGDGYDEWSFVHTYGVSNTVRYPEVNEDEVRSQVLAELQTEGNPATAGIRVVGTFMIHDIDSILGLNALPWLAGVNSIQDLNVMRLVGITADASQGCNAFPIAVHKGVRSVTSGTFPERRDFGPGSPTPSYSDFLPEHQDNMAMLASGDQQLPLFGSEDPPVGSVFKIQNGFGSGNFGWLNWNLGRPIDANTLAGSLTYPGNSTDYTTPPWPQGQEIPYVRDGKELVGRIYGYVEPGDPTDTSMNVGDYVAAITGNVDANAVRQVLAGHIDEDRIIRVVVWDEAEDPGSNGLYRIFGFAQFRLIGFNLTGNDSWILAEFRGWSWGCGEES